MLSKQNKITIGQRIREERCKQNMPLTELASRVGITKQSLYKYEIGIITNIPLSNIEKISTVLGLSPAYLMGWNENPSPSKFDNLPEPNITENYTTFPVIGEVAAGYECVAAEDWAGELIDIPNEYLVGRNKSDFFVLKVKGDSMYPQYQHGDKVLILKQSTMDYSGQIGVVIYGDDMGTLKKIEYAQGEDWMKLVPVNPNHPTVRIENEDLEHCRVLGIPRLLIREIKD